ncbi:MAG: hypothetical protein GX134_03085 [candidate division WS1 bacterium]|jgi:hypothetical protein|nr:hypothetical protein [candidate division WS1 bacterium]
MSPLDAGTEATPLIQDPTYDRGFLLYDPQPGRHVVRGHLPPGATDPVWGLAQWSSRTPLEEGDVVEVPDGYGAANAGRSAIARPRERYLRLELNGSLEYVERARRHGEPWSHLLAEQRLAPHPMLSNLAALPFRLTARVAKCEKRNTEDYDPGVHAAQYQWFVTVQNLREGSPGYGDYYWFGIQLFDDRNPVPPAGCHVDLGTSKLIYAPGGDTYASESTHGGGPVTFEGDLLPEVLVGLERAWAQGLLGDSQDLADYRLGGMNIGWEVPGVFDAAVELWDLELLAVPK